MSRLIRPLRRASLKLLLPSKPSQFSTASYVSEMRQTAVKDRLLRLIRDEIRYELDHEPPRIHPSKYYSYSISDQPGDQFITLETKFADGEEVKIEATLVDKEVPIPNSRDGGPKDEIELHITLVATVIKKDDAMEIICSAWPDRIEVQKLYVRSKEGNSDKLYDGPAVKELDERLEEAIYDFLAVRGIDDGVAVFLHDYMKNKQKSEYLRWMGVLKSHIEQN